ncbi:MAG: hypothetical protein HYV63_25545 [Candidatus Schekmanbacteria bacterium]|nr:hypothetical protein [Candidatus Schekmanbacteria bacterium]
MTKSLSRLACAAALAAMLAASSPARVAAFAEDVCFFYTDSSEEQVFYYPFNCFDLECLDGPSSGSAAAGTCAISGLATYLGAAFKETFQASNTVHFDAIFLLGRMAGLTDAEASTLALYDQATDLGVYDPIQFAGRNTAGKYVANVTPGNRGEANLTGLDRDQQGAAGYWFHYVPWMKIGEASRHALTINGYKGYVLDPEKSDFDEYEMPLIHLRNFAFDSERHLCVLGLTDDSGACLAGNAYVSTPMFTEVTKIDGVSPLGSQGVHLTSDGGTPDTYTDDVYASGDDLSGKVEGLGIYLHALGDRLSHDNCTNVSPLVKKSGSWTEEGDEDGNGTPNETKTYEYSMDYDESCGQVNHALHHYSETGHGADTPQRTFDGLELEAREIFAWAIAKNKAGSAPEPRTGFPSPYVHAEDGTISINEAFFPAMIGSPDSQGKLVQAIAKCKTTERLADMCKLGKDGYGVLWHDDNKECLYPTYQGENSTCK